MSKSSSIRLARMRRSLIALAISSCLMSAAPIFAQSNATGSIHGSADPGTSVVIQNTSTGQSRTVTVDASGRYQAPSLPLGNYKVLLQRDGETIAIREDVAVNLGGSSLVSFAQDSTTLETVVVTSDVPPIDVSSTDVRSVFTSEQLDKLTVGRSVNAVALLAPGVIQGDSRYNRVASFGGASVTENAYYINGYPVTNPLTALGSTTLPFNGIDQAQVLTSGYGAEFGRATGGVVNLVTKSGGNDWQFGAQVFWNPDSATRRNIYVPDAGTALDGELYQNREDYEDDSFTYGLYASGPIIKDRLFFFVSGEYQDRDVESYGARAGSPTSFGELKYGIPRWLAKIDWNITDNHSLEFTAVSDEEKRDEFLYSYAYTAAQAEANNAQTGENLGPFERGRIRNGGGYYRTGGQLYIGKYTGYLTDDLVVSLLYGRQKQDRFREPWGYDSTVTYVAGTPYAGANPVRYGTVDQLDDPDAYDETNGGRLDVIWTLGDHTLRLGYDRIDSTSREGTTTAGPGYYWLYNYGAPNEPIQGGGGAIVPGNGQYVSRVVYNNGGEFDTEQYAYYLEDRWQVTDNVLLSLGIRNENFINYNGDGISYLEGKDQWAPRLGFTWDAFGDSSLKVFGNLGRYHLTVPNTVAQRGASGSTYTNEYFSYDSIDPGTGIPQGIQAIGDGPYSANGEYGQAPDPATVAAVGLKPYYQDELVLGFEKQLGAAHFGGLRYVYRELGSMIDDACDQRPVRNWGLANGFSPEEAENLWWNNTSGCRMINPGEANTFVVYDDDGNAHVASLSAEEMGFPEMVRKYHALNFFLERPFDGTWYYRVDYTWSHNYGNGEGMTNSDIGQSVSQAAQTQSWDHVEQAEGAYGNLPNDRRHQIKALAMYQLNPEWRFSSTLTAYSGRPKNCNGYYNGVNAEDDYTVENVLYPGPYYWFCNNEPSPRGSLGNLPWTFTVDLGVSYAPSFADNKLQFGLDVFNVFDRQTVQNVVEYGENGGPGVPYAYTGRVVSYSAPRSLRFSVRYDF